MMFNMLVVLPWSSSWILRPWRWWWSVVRVVSGAGLSLSPHVHSLPAGDDVTVILIVNSVIYVRVDWLRRLRSGVVTATRKVHFQYGGSWHCWFSRSKDVSPILPLDVAVEEGEVTDKEAATDTGDDDEDVAVGWRFWRRICSGSVSTTSRTVRSRGSGLRGHLDIVCGVVTVTLLIGGQDGKVVGGRALEIVHSKFCAALDDYKVIITYI